MIITAPTVIEEPVAIACDRCNKKIPKDDPLEFQEVITIKFRGGYKSVFGDGNLVEIDLCQECGRTLFGSFVRITEIPD